MLYKLSSGCEMIKRRNRVRAKRISDIMDKKYQVFVSSTYEDLQDERKAVMEALLQMNCFPVGMEYFNAADDSQWDVITSLIDECDYYVLIVAGRYGTIDEASGKSYTQKEYEYAVKKGVPTISFVHKDIKQLPSGKVESDPEAVKKLEAFRNEVGKKLWQIWDNKDSLASAVVLSLNQLIKSKPRSGWVRNVSLSAEANKQILALKEENEALRAKLKQVEDEDPKGIEVFQQGEDIIKVDVSYYYGKTHYLKIDLSWNRIISILAPVLVDESSEEKMKNVFIDSIREDILKKDRNYINNHSKVEEESFQQIKVQLIALRVIELSDKKRTIKDTETYWRLTAYGFRVMMNLKALKKDSL